MSAMVGVGVGVRERLLAVPVRRVLKSTPSVSYCEGKGEGGYACGRKGGFKCGCRCNGGCACGREDESGCRCRCR